MILSYVISMVKIFFYQQFNVFKYAILKTFKENKQKVNNLVIYVHYHNITTKNDRCKNKYEQINIQKDSNHYHKFYYHNQY